MKKVDFPREIEDNYAAELRKVVKTLEKKLKKLINQKTNDLSDKDFEDISVEFEEISKDYLTTDFCIDITVTYTTQTVEYAINQVKDQVKKINNIAVKSSYDTKEIKDFLSEQVKLIKAEPGKYIRTFDKQTRKIIKEGVEEGLSSKTIAKALKETTRIEMNRANLIARDQIGSLFGKATRTQFKGIGLKKFEWVTVGDNRVRETHRDRAGQIYEWDNPPEGEIPGQPIACRCVASVVVDEVLAL